MAYIAFAAILASLFAIVAGAVVDGIFGTTIVETLKQATQLLGITNSLLTAIVGTYYGFSSLRPSS